MDAKLISFIMEQAETQPISRRIVLYRELAAEVTVKEEKAQLLTLAEDLESIRERTHQLIFNFANRS